MTEALPYHGRAARGEGKVGLCRPPFVLPFAGGEKKKNQSFYFCPSGRESPMYLQFSKRGKVEPVNPLFDLPERGEKEKNALTLSRPSRRGNPHFVFRKEKKGGGNQQRRITPLGKRK